MGHILCDRPSCAGCVVEAPALLLGCRNPGRRESGRQASQKSAAAGVNQPIHRKGLTPNVKRVSGWVEGELPTDSKSSSGCRIRP